MKESFAEVIIILIQICWQLVYYFKHFCKVRTVILCKVKKNFYTSSHFWRLIALLNIVEKTIETVTAKQIWRMTKKHNMLFAHQINAHQNQFTETALNLLINQVHKIWWNKNHIVLLLFLNITEVYDHMIHSNQVKKISKQLTEWVQAFMTNKISILMLLLLLLFFNWGVCSLRLWHLPS